MNLTIPQRVLATSLTAGDKLIIGILLSNPSATKREVARAIGVTERMLYRAIKNAKTSGINIKQYDTGDMSPTSQSDTSDIQCDTGDTVTGVIQCDTGVIQCDTGDIHNKQTNKQTSRESCGPSFKEVEKFAFQMKRPDLADEFFEHYEESGWMHGGKPLGNWRAMFRGWCRRTPYVDTTLARGTTPLSGSGERRLTLEEARFIQDQSY